MKWFKRWQITMWLLMAACGVPAHAATPSGGTEHVPATWTHYATAASHQLQVELADTQDPAATRLHRFLDDTAETNPNAPPPAPIIRLWIGGNGKIARAEFASLGNAQANADLGQIILNTRFPQTLPKNLPQPLVLRLNLTCSI